MAIRSSRRGAPAYCPYYCEENIWHLCADLVPDQAPGAGQRLALLISNPNRQVALWGQRAADDADLPVVWDYHVICAQETPAAWCIWDLDSRLGAPTPLPDYLAHSFRPVPTQFAPLFRVMACDDYRRLLATDRRHMRRADGAYCHPPPRWPVIGSGHNLARFIDMDDHFAGEILDLDGVWGWFAAHRADRGDYSATPGTRR